MNRSDGSTAAYYELPEGCKELQHLISHRDMNAQIGEIFRACYRYGIASHSDKLRDAKKMRFYAQAEIERLEKLLAPEEPAAAIDDDSERMQVIGQNGNDGAAYKGADSWQPTVSPFPHWANCEVEGRSSFARLFAVLDLHGNCFSERGRKFNMSNWKIVRVKQD